MGQCPKCGTAVRPDQPTCENCGTDLDALQRAQSVATQTAAAAAGAASVQKPRRTFAPVGLGLQAAAALTLSLLFQWLVQSVVPTEAYLYRLFRPSGGWVMSIVPAMIAFVFVWALIDLFLKFRTVRVNERDAARSEVKQLPVLLGTEGPSLTLQRVRAWDRGMLARPVGRRILWLLHHLGTTDAQRAHELVRHQSDVDADAAASNYRAVKLFIWALPILGFIGTVLGISLAVGGFSEFLTTSVSIDEVDAVTAELGEVASGLSFAFDTTLLGLLAGLVANVISSGVQSREEGLLTRLEELGLRIMANAQPALATAAAPVVGMASGATEAFERMLAGRMEEIQAQMENFSRAVQAGLDGLRETSSRMNSGLAQSIGSVSTTVEGLGSDIESVSGALTQGMTGLGSEIETVSTNLAHRMTGLGSEMETVSTTLAHGMTGLGSEIENVSSELTRGMTGLGARVSSMEQTSGRAEEAMERLSSSVSELGQRVAEYRETQAALAPVLSQLAGPLELRLMPTPQVPLAPPTNPAPPPSAPERS